MATNVCFYFQVHQPYRIRPYTVFDVGHRHDYFDENKNRAIMEKVAQKCYLPTNQLMLELLHQHSEFKISYSISGVALEQFENYKPEVIDSFRRLVETGRVELLSETYYHSLAFLYSHDEFVQQVAQHKAKLQSLFGVTPTTFRNTELIYNNELAHVVDGLGYKAILAEGADHVLDWRSPNFVYAAPTAPDIKLLLKNYKLSDDIAFRFSNKLWNEYPLTVDKYAGWLSDSQGDTINLFMDYETFGEHQWADSGIFEFLRALPAAVGRYQHLQFATPSEVAANHEPVSGLDIHHLISWADMERDLSAWLGNKMQQSALKEIFGLETDLRVLQSADPAVLDDWHKLLTSDHFYYMCTKWFSDGDVHKYFNPYDSPYDAFLTYMNVLNDLIIRVQSPRSQHRSA